MEPVVRKQNGAVVRKTNGVSLKKKETVVWKQIEIKDQDWKHNIKL